MSANVLFISLTMAIKIGHGSMGGSNSKRGNIKRKNVGHSRDVGHRNALIVTTVLASTVLASTVSLGGASATELSTPELAPDLLTQLLEQSASISAPQTSTVSPNTKSFTAKSTGTQSTGIRSTGNIIAHTKTAGNSNNTIYTEHFTDTQSISHNKASYSHISYAEIDYNETVLPSNAVLSSTQLSPLAQPIASNQTELIQPEFIQVQPHQPEPTQASWLQIDIAPTELAPIDPAPIELAQTESANNPSKIGPPKFGKAGTQRWYLQAGAAADFDDDTFLLAGAGISHFFYDGHSANLELNGLSFSQPGADAVGATLTFLVRSHWIRGENWSIYVDGGAGIIFTTGDVPEIGSSFNFTPQVGGGASFAINENQRLMTGLRWYHISNANTFEVNPGLDTLFGYVGINFPL